MTMQTNRKPGATAAANATVPDGLYPDHEPHRGRPGAGCPSVVQAVGSALDRRYLHERLATLNEVLNRLGLVLARKGPSGPPFCHAILLGCSGSLQNPTLAGRK